MNIQCQRCDHAYELDAERDVMNVYAIDAKHSHICSKCPACGLVMRLFADREQLQEVINTVEDLKVIVHSREAPKAIRALASQAKGGKVGKHSKDQAEPVIYIPREWLVELLDTIRHFAQPCDGSCGVHS